MSNGHEDERAPVRKREQSERGAYEGPLSNLREEIDRLFDDFSTRWLSDPFGRRKRGLGHAPRPGAFDWADRMPAIDVSEKGDDIVIRADLPGMDENDIEVRISQGKLTISGETKEQREEGQDGGTFHISERHYGAFRRTIQIPEGVDEDKVDASFEKGVLTVRLPKPPEAEEKSRKIEVRSKPPMDQ